MFSLCDKPKNILVLTAHQCDFTHKPSVVAMTQNNSFVGPQSCGDPNMFRMFSCVFHGIQKKTEFYRKFCCGVRHLK